MKTKDTYYLNRCLELAKKGLGNVQINPMVGAVLVHNNRIIGEGYHQKFGEAHAEVNCINSVKAEDQKLIKDATLYVNLEPCCHFGKTPPCANLIIANEIKKVIIANKDPNPKVAGGGIERLKGTGIEVFTGIEKEKATWLNRRFFTFQEKKRPYIILKWAQTKNGFFAKNDHTQEWISNEIFSPLNHKWRTEEAAILVGTNTAKIDNPSLTARNWQGNTPTRVLLDKKLSVDKKSNLYNANAKTIIFNEIEEKQVENIIYVKANFEENLLKRICNYLFQNSICSLIVEGGAFTLNKFIEANLWDEARVIVADKEWEDGLKAPVLNHSQQFKEQKLKDNQIFFYKNLEL